MQAQDIFTTVILIQMFFSFGVTGLAYYMPDDSLVYISDFTKVSEQTDLEDIRDEVEGNLEQQTNIPIIELGALVFYSGNILLDLILNFAFAVPQMVTLLLNTFMMLVNVPSVMSGFVLMFAGVAVSVLYFISIINYLVGIRSGRFS